MHYPKEIERVDAPAVQGYPVIGCDVRRCPYCGRPLSFSGAGNQYPLCRHCHRHTKETARRFTRRFTRRFEIS